MNFNANLIALWQRRELIYVLVGKHMKEKHVGTILGWFWTFYNALFPLFSSVLVFYFIARIQVPGTDGLLGYILFVFSGLLPWLMFSRTVGEGIDILHSSIDLLRQAIFPVEVLSLVSAIEHLFVLFLQSVLLTGIFAYLHFSALPKILLLPFFFLFMFAFCLGLSWIFSIAGFILRDLKDIVAAFIQFLFYLTPIAFAPENIPVQLRFIINLNPMTHAVNFFRDILYYEQIQNPLSPLIFCVTAVVVLIVGYWAILRVKTTVGDMV